MSEALNVSGREVVTESDRDPGKKREKARGERVRRGRDGLLEEGQEQEQQ